MLCRSVDVSNFWHVILMSCQSYVWRSFVGVPTKSGSAILSFVPGVYDTCNCTSFHEVKVLSSNEKINKALKTKFWKCIFRKKQGLFWLRISWEKMSHLAKIHEKLSISSEKFVFYPSLIYIFPWDLLSHFRDFSENFGKKWSKSLKILHQNNPWKNM